MAQAHKKLLGFCISGAELSAFTSLSQSKLQLRIRRVALISSAIDANRQANAETLGMCPNSFDVFAHIANC
jgi:hypothetical protein